MQGFHTCILPEKNVSEGRLVPGIRIIGAGTLEQLCRDLNKKEGLGGKYQRRKQSLSLNRYGNRRCYMMWITVISVDRIW